MRPSFKDLKRNSREILMGNYSLVILAYLFVELLSSLLTSLFAPTSPELTMVQSVIYYLASFIISILTMVLSAGLLKIIMNMIRREPIRPGMVFFALRSQADRFIIASFLMSLLLLVPFAIPLAFYKLMIPTDSAYPGSYDAILVLLVVLAAVVAVALTLRYNFVFQILLDDIYCGAIEAFKRSSELMKGNCGRLLLLDLSFLGWVGIGILSFGIGFLWIAPYYQTVTTYFYFSLTGELTPAEEAPNGESQNGEAVNDEV